MCSCQIGYQMLALGARFCHYRNKHLFVGKRQEVPNNWYQVIVPLNSHFEPVKIFHRRKLHIEGLMPSGWIGKDDLPESCCPPLTVNAQNSGRQIQLVYFNFYNMWLSFSCCVIMDLWATIIFYFPSHLNTVDTSRALKSFSQNKGMRGLQQSS